MEDSLNRKMPPDLDKLQMLGRLISGITHEINTPLHYLEHNLTFLKISFKDLLSLLTSCRGLLERIKSGDQISSTTWQALEQLESEVEPEYLESEIAKTLEQSLEGMDMVARIVLALKDFSHPAQQEFLMTDINKCVDTVCTISRHEWKIAADLQLELASDLPFLFCSRDEIHQVLLNLVVNSAHAVNEKKETGAYDRGLITVTTTSLGDRVEIKVCDDGIGIAPEHQSLIFNPDFTTKKAGAGTGFGLNLVRRIVEERHQGSISFESRPGEGTVFKVILPHRQPEKSVSGEKK
ncbi:MAG: PAS/PAC sensor signal transduction histidine kinase [uncultured bacterium]|nr:MAG: PAS/PAC sensor signal transduction histidine kinase [uncultured bacterium]